MVMRLVADAEGGVSSEPRSHVDDGKIFKVDTVPPPPGESDAYNAPTRIGTLDAEEWRALMDIRESDLDSRVEREPASTSGPPSAHERSAPPKPMLAIPPPAPPPPDTIPRLDVDDDDDVAANARLSWPALGAAAMIAVQEVQRASTAPSAPRPSAFPEWVAGTNVQEQAALEAARRRRVRSLVRFGVVVVLALGGLVAIILRH